MSGGKLATNIHIKFMLRLYNQININVRVHKSAYMYRWEYIIMSFHANASMKTLLSFRKKKIKIFAYVFTNAIEFAR